MERTERIKYLWIKHKIWLEAPPLIGSMLLTKVFDIPFTWHAWRKAEYKIYAGSRPWKSKVHKELILVDKSYIKNKKARRMVSNKMFVYRVEGRKSQSNQELIYISKCKLDYETEYSYFNSIQGIADKRLKDARVMRENDYSEIEPQFYVWMCAVDKKKEELMIKGDEYYYNIKVSKAIEKLVKTSIKTYDLFDYTRSIDGQWNDYPVIIKACIANRLDLVESLIDACENAEDLQEMVNMKWVHDDGGYYESTYGKKPSSFTTSDDIKNILTKYEID